jgi:hypothetical protein
MRMRQIVGFGCVAAMVVGMVMTAAGCMTPAATTTTSHDQTPVDFTQPQPPHAHAHSHDASSHNHDRGHMMIASNGAVEALLTSHLSSKSGNELDVFVEKDGKPLALTTTKLDAKAKSSKDGGDAKTLMFECAPEDERPAGEKAGTCSHFVARAAWMNPQDRLEVATNLPLLSGDIAYTWRSFDPKKYAHHIE